MNPPCADALDVKLSSDQMKRLDEVSAVSLGTPPEQIHGSTAAIAGGKPELLEQPSVPTSTMAPANTAVYSATKAAVDAVTRSLAKELGSRNIRVNSINPGMVETEGVYAAGIMESDFRKQVQSQTALGRIGQPQDIAPAAVFLASSDSAWITGETFYITGGLR